MSLFLTGLDNTAVNVGLPVIGGAGDGAAGGVAVLDDGVPARRSG
jgi:hypothetical protein